jgi:hypothetical protein
MSLKHVIYPACVLALLLVAGKIEGNDQPGSCVVYFSVLENDELPVHRSILKMNEPQNSWYERYGNRDKYTGICYVENGARVPDDEPLYAMVWGEHLASEPYSYSYEATAAARAAVTAGAATDQNGNTGTVSGTTSTSEPVSRSSAETKKHYVVDGWLAVWNIATSESKGKFVPIGPLHSRSRGDLSSASASLLKDAMEQISQREKERLAAAGKGWAVVTIKPTDNPKPAASENPSSTSQSSVDTVDAAVQVSAVKVTSTVPGAEIFVDQDFVGNTPSTINVPAGKHVITVKKSGFQDWARTVDFAGGSITLEAELRGEGNETGTADPPAKADRSTEPAEPVSTRSTQTPVGWIGVSTKNDGKGALVTDVTAEGPAALAGIHVGDVILTLDGRPVKSAELQTLVAAYKPGTRVPISYASGLAKHEVWITVASETEEH